MPEDCVVVAAARGRGGSESSSAEGGGAGGARCPPVRPRPGRDPGAGGRCLCLGAVLGKYPQTHIQAPTRDAELLGRRCKRAVSILDTLGSEGKEMLGVMVIGWSRLGWGRVQVLTVSCPDLPVGWFSVSAPFSPHSPFYLAL